MNFNFDRKKKKGGCALFSFLLLAALFLGMAPAHAQPALELRSFPVVATTISGATSIGIYTNVTTGGAYTTTNANGTTGLPIVQGYGIGVTIVGAITNGTANTNGTFTAYFSPSVDGTNYSTQTNQWWGVVLPPNGIGSLRVTNSFSGGSNFSSTMLAGYRYLHCVGFWNAASNNVTGLRVLGTVPLALVVV